MPYRNKTYVAFDGDTDIHYYRLMCAWKQNDGIDFNFHDAHDLNSARDSSLESSIKNQLRERFKNSKCFVILIGSKTRYLTKFVQWEIEQAISLNLPIIAVNIDNSRKMLDSTCPPALKNQLAIFVPFKQKIVQYAMDNWPSDHANYKAQGKAIDYYYFDSVYTSLGL